MHGLCPPSAKTAMQPTDKDVGKSVQSPTKSVSDENWFADMVRATLAKPGLELHLATGFDERSCHRYAAGTVRPPAFLLRAMLRCEQGRTFLEFIMDGAEPEWWHEFKRAGRIAAQFDKMDLE